ncbi:hypothetical protein [Asaia astilbis]
MRRMLALMAFTMSLLAQALPAAHATPERPVEQDGRRLDFDSRAALRCTMAPHLVRTAFKPAERETGRNAPRRTCVSETDRIGAGYTQFVRNSAVRHPHHRMRG